ncbi:MAG: VOC family protein [Acidimicrobiales bacterium]
MLGVLGEASCPAQSCGHTLVQATNMAASFMAGWLTMSLARIRSVVLDCPNPRALAEFYLGLLGGEVDADVDDWVVLTVTGLRLAFQLADDFAPPTWPSGERPQQFHLDMTVDDVDVAERQVLTLGARKHATQPGESAGDRFRVYLDPVGHPFCLCWG